MKAIIEIPAGSHYKYEFKNERLVLDRVINQPIPFNYGYFEHTLCGDGDPLDVFILSKMPLVPGAEVNISLIGGLLCVDNSEIDDKLIGILEGEETWFAHYYEKHFNQIKEYLLTYKTGFEIVDEMNLEESYYVHQKAKNDFTRDL